MGDSVTKEAERSESAADPRTRSDSFAEIPAITNAATSVTQMGHRLKGLARFGFDPSAESRFIILLAVVFVISFAIPVVFAAKVGGLIGKQTVVEDEPDLFPSALVIGSFGRFIRVVEPLALDPVEGEDFLLGGWFQFRRLPAAGETMPLITKYDASLSSKAGYSLAITRDGDVLRPSVYWRNSRGKGGWHEFSALSIDQGKWVLFLVSVRGGRLLGLHTGQFDAKGRMRVSLSGGFELPETVYPESSVPLVIGSNSAIGFQGRVGPFGILAMHSSSPEDLKQALNEIAESPATVPSYFGKEAVRLWSLGSKKDESRFGRTIEAVGGRAKHRESGGEAVSGDAKEVPAEAQ